MDRISILIVDDHEVIHSGISDILKKEKRLEIVAHAYNGEEAIEKALQLKPNIIFMDISMPKKNGIEATSYLSEKIPETKIIALTQHDENEYVVQFLKSGGLGFLLKNSKQEEFIKAIETVLENKRYLSYELSVSLAERLMEENNSDNQSKKVHLTRREIEIVQKIAEDKHNQEIADELHISLRTVETHRRNIAQKLNAKSVVSIIRYAAQNNLIDL